MAFRPYDLSLYTTQVKELFDVQYCKEYSTSQISRKFNYAHDDVNRWVNRNIEHYYPIVIIDAMFIHT